MALPTTQKAVNENVDIQDKGCRVKVKTGDAAYISYLKGNVFTFDFLTPNVLHFIVLDLDRHEYNIPLNNLTIDGVAPKDQDDAQDILDKILGNC